MSRKKHKNRKLLERLGTRADGFDADAFDEVELEDDELDEEYDDGYAIEDQDEDDGSWREDAWGSRHRGWPESDEE